MDAALTAAAPAHGHSHSENKFHIYVQIAMILAVITGVEILLIFLPFATWILVGSLVVLSGVKFLFVIFIFMHLRWDKVFCTILFFIGLVLGGGTLGALLALFRASTPLSFAP